MSYVWSNTVKVSPTSSSGYARIEDVAIIVNGQRVSEVNIGDKVVVAVTYSIYREGNYRVCIQVSGRSTVCANVKGEPGKTYRTAWTWKENGPEGDYILHAVIYYDTGIGKLPIHSVDVAYKVISYGGGYGGGYEEGGGYGGEEKKETRISMIPFYISGAIFAVAIMAFVISRLKK